MDTQVQATTTLMSRANRPWIIVWLGFAVALTSVGCSARSRDTGTHPSAIATSPEPSPTIAAIATTTAAPTPARPFICPADSSGRAAGGPVTPADLCNATLLIPSWADSDTACAHGTVHMKDGKSPPLPRTNSVASQIRIATIVGADVDHDGVAEAVVVISCPVGDPPLDQVVAFGRTASGTIHTLGQVIGPVNGGINKATGLAANSDGSIRVEVTKVLGSDDHAVASQVHQWRTYSWGGQRFTQTAGSTSFDADKSTTHLTIAATSIVLAKPQGAVRHGSLTVTVANTGATPAAGVSIRPILTEGITGVAESPGTVSFVIVSCTVGDIAAGTSRKITLDVTVETAFADMVAENPTRNFISSNVVQLLVGDQLYTTTAGLAMTLNR